MNLLQSFKKGKSDLLRQWRKGTSAGTQLFLDLSVFSAFLIPLFGLHSFQGNAQILT